MTIDTYNIRFYKNNSRVAPGTLDDADARLFYKQLKLFVEKYEGRYGERLNNESILIILDDKNIYRRRGRLESAGIETIQDLIDYLGLEKDPEYMIVNNIIIKDKSIKLDGIYVIQLYTSWLYLTDAQLKRI